METTIVLMQMWGIGLLALGVGFYISKRYYTKLYKDLDKQSFAVFVFAVLAIAAGLAQVQAHNVWDTFNQAIISILGWGTLLKGIIFAIAPQWVNRTAEWEADSKLIPLVGAFMILIGAYLAWTGFIVY